MTPSKLPALPGIVVRTPEADYVTLHPGDLIGRLRSAALFIDDPRVSEAHAILSLRGTSLWLFGLRGGLQVRRTWRSEVKAEPGLKVGLADDIEIELIDVALPQAIFVLADERGAKTPLDRPEWSILPDGSVVPGFARDGMAWLWSSAGVWRFQVSGEDGQELRPQDTFSCAGRQYEIVHEPVATADVVATVSAEWNVPPLTVEVWEQHTSVVVDGRPPVEITGNAHRILRTTAGLTERGGSIHWSAVAESIWRVNGTEQNWFTNHRRLQQRLRDLRLPPNLVCCTGGQVWLVMRSGIDELVMHDRHLM